MFLVSCLCPPCGISFARLKRITLICALASLTATWDAGAVLATGIEAIVHDSVITFDQVQKLTSQTADVLRKQYANKPEEFQKRMGEVRQENLEKLMSRELILHEFKKAGYSLPDSVINDIVEARLKDQFGDRRNATKNLQARGLTYEKFREQERERFIVEAMRNKNISSEIIVSPQKIEDYYKAHPDDFKLEDQVKMRMIVRGKTAPSGSSTNAPDTRKLFEEILTQLKGGASFAEMATLYSQGSEAKSGGERAWEMIPDLRTELREPVSRLNPGQLSDIIETPEAFYLLKIEEKKPAHVQALAEVRTQIEQELSIRERDRLEKQWIERLKKKTFVRYFQF